MRTLHEILLALHTIPTTIKGDNPMDRIANAESEIKALNPTPVMDKGEEKINFALVKSELSTCICKAALICGSKINQDRLNDLANEYADKIQALFLPVMREDKEIVICAAIKYKCGLLIRGHRHSDCIRNALDRENIPESKGAKQGFITSKNRFVERKEAMDIQVAVGMKSMWTKDGEYNGNILFSEDLY